MLEILEIQRSIVIGDHLPRLAGWLAWVVVVVELFAVAILVIGLVRFGYEYVRSELGGHDMVARKTSANLARVVLARYILMALEVFIVADILMTLLSASFSDLLFLGFLVLVRSVISYFLEHEIRQIEAEDRRE